MQNLKTLKNIFNSINLLIVMFFALGSYSYANDVIELTTPKETLSLMALKDDIPYANAPFALSKFVEGQGFPNTVKNFKTDMMGFYTLNNFEANTKYELRAKELRTVSYVDDKLVFETNADGKIYKLYTSNEMFQNDPIMFIALDQSGNLSTQEVSFRVVDKNGNPVEGVPFTANNITLLSSYQTKNSDSDGIVKFELEARGTYTGNIRQDFINAKSYSITLSKNGQFMWDFRPEEITVHIFQNDVVAMDGRELKFVVEKNDRTYLITDLKKLIQEAKDYVEKNQFTNANAVERLKETVKIAEEELAKETIPGYAEAFIVGIKTEIEKVKKFEIPKRAEISSGENLSLVRPDLVNSSASKKDDTKNNMIAMINIGDNSYQIKEDGKLITKTFEVAPFLSDGRVMLPARAIAELLKSDVKFDNTTKIAKFIFANGEDSSKQNILSITLGQKSMFINGKEVKLSADMINQNGRILIPMSDMQKALKELGLKVGFKWDNTTKTLLIEEVEYNVN